MNQIFCFERFDKNLTFLKKVASSVIVRKKTSPEEVSTIVDGVIMQKMVTPSDDSLSSCFKANWPAVV